MMQLKIGTNFLTVTNVYPYRYDYGKGKEVLRIEALESDHNFNDLLVLKDCTKDIEYLEDGVLKNTYTNYSLDFNCLYNAGKYNIEVTRKSEESIRLEAVERKLAELLGK